MKFYIYTRIVVVIAVVVLSRAVGVESKSACTGIVIKTPQIGNLPVMQDPTYRSLSIYELTDGAIIPVYSTYVDLETGEVWYETNNGYVQGRGGYTTDDTQVIITDYPCSLQLKHYGEN